MIISGIDVLLGVAFMPFDIGRGLWSLIYFPLFTTLSFNYLIACKYSESLYLWLIHSGLLAALLYLIFVTLGILKSNNFSEKDSP